MKADEAHALFTMTRVVPLYRKFKRVLALGKDGLAVLASMEKLYEQQTELLLAEEASFTSADTRTLLREREELIASFPGRRRAMAESPRLDVHRRLGVLRSDALADERAGAAAAAPQAAAAADAPQAAAAAGLSRDRLLKCTADGCAGLFSLGKGSCLVCLRKHCTRCLDALTGDAPHACAEGARDSAREVLAQTKSCPRCYASIVRASGCPQVRGAGPPLNPRAAVGVRGRLTPPTDDVHAVPLHLQLDHGPGGEGGGAQPALFCAERGGACQGGG